MSFFSRLGLGTPTVPAAPPVTAPAAAAPPVPGATPSPAANTPVPAMPPRVAPPPPTDPASLLAERNSLIGTLAQANTAHAQVQEQLTQANAAVTTLTGELAAANATIATLTTERDTARAAAGQTVEQVRNQQLATLAASQGIPPQQVPPVDPTAAPAADGSSFQEGYKAAAAKNPLAASAFILDTLKIKF